MEGSPISSLAKEMNGAPQSVSGAVTSLGVKVDADEQDAQQAKLNGEAETNGHSS